jgi:AraC family transcriptional regulator of adaptative response/methylated-DNA-[protein]-cysteine methyltransferase
MNQNNGNHRRVALVDVIEDEIPAGETRSYAEVARAIGDPKAVRAVATACASNPVALAVPCHRVVRSDGELAGYRWGIERKKKLLEQERLDQ